MAQTPGIGPRKSRKTIFLLAGGGLAAAALAVVVASNMGNDEQPQPENAAAPAASNAPAPLPTNNGMGRLRYLVPNDTGARFAPTDAQDIPDFVIKGGSCVDGVMDSAPQNGYVRIHANYLNNPDKTANEDFFGYVNLGQLKQVSDINSCTATFGKSSAPVAPVQNPEALPTGFYIAPNGKEFHNRADSTKDSYVGEIGGGQCIEVTSGGYGSDYVVATVRSGAAGEQTQTYTNLYTTKDDIRPDPTLEGRCAAKWFSRLVP